MADFVDIWTLILQSNTFNFALFLIILIAIAQKIDIPTMLEKLKSEVAQKVEDAKNAKKVAFEDLRKAELSIENVGQEITKMLGEAENSANTMGKKIVDDAYNEVRNIENNAKKLINSENKNVVSELTQETSLKSVDLAKKHIQNVLASRPELHQRYINESINALDRLNF